MTRVHGPVRLVTDDPAGVTQVLVRAPRLRTHDGGVVMDLPQYLPVSGGVLDIELLPGPAVISLVSHNQQRPGISVVVPDIEEITLEGAIQAAQVADDADRRVLELLAAQVAADRETVAADRQAVTQAKIDVGGLTARAEDAAGDAETHAELAEEQAGIATEASGKAIVSEQAAAQSASDADSDRVAAEQASTRAVQAEQVATGAATTAANKATEAGLAADRAEQATAGKADLVGGKVPSSQIPEVALTKPFPVISRAEMLALEAQEGDIAIISTGADKGSYILGSGPASDFASWLLMAVSADVPVQSVNGQVGNVNLGASDVGAAPVTHTHTPASIGAAPATHQHTMSQVTDLPAFATNAAGGTAAMRNLDGTLAAAAPKYATDVATKSYVDGRTPKIEIVASLPSPLVAGTMYVVAG